MTKVDMDLEENDVDESKFEAMCSTKKCSLLDDWPLQNDQSGGAFRGKLSQLTHSLLNSKQ